MQDYTEYVMDKEYHIGSVNDSNSALIGRADTLRVCPKRFADDSVSLERLLRALFQFLVGEFHIDGTAWDIDDDDVSINQFSDITS